MTFFELKAAIQSRIWDIIHRNGWQELDEFSITLSEKLARKMISSKGELGTIIMKILSNVKTNFFKINGVTKKRFADELVEELDYVYRLFQPILKNKHGKKNKGKYKDVQRRDFSDDTQLEVLRDQDHRCAICGRILNVVDYDHIDGDRSNNERSNCQAICPYCHAIKSRRKQSNA